ncbi:MAG TPA: DUF4097 family beta strand repeat-containing protein [Terriglobales bacterium]|nr:DUF4097 family beta strand repeat-containing protein [Terriglobales bacterium]
MRHADQMRKLVISIVLALAMSKVLLAQSPTPTPNPFPAPEVRVSAHPHPRVHIHDADQSEMTLSEKETINKSIPLPSSSGRRSVTIDNVWGSIHVAGTNSAQVDFVATKTIRAETKEALEQAKKDVTLDITQPANAVSLYVNGPFRCQCNCQCDSCVNVRERPGYVVKYDFDVKVPRDVDLTVRTVNDGDVSVADVTGQYSVRNVNGSVEMTNVAGSGTAKTVNGELKVLFRGNPQTNSSFATLNGDVDLYFLPKLSADLRFKTFNGEVFTDFPMSALPPRQPVEEHTGGKFVFRADRFTGGRVAAGGPEIKVETLNGDIHIRERHD